MRRLPASGLTLFTAALLVLLPALAVLQYQWVGQVSAAERERMQRNMTHAAQQFRQSFDGEIARAFAGLQVDGATARDEAWDRYAERYAAWTRTAVSPSLVANVYLIDADGRQVRLRRWNAESRRFEAAAWEGPLGASRGHFTEQLRAFAADGTFTRGGDAPFRHDASLLVAPLFNVSTTDAPGRMPHRQLVHVFGFTVLQLDLPFIREQFVPALARRHFTHANDADYRATVIDGDAPGEAIYRSSPDAPTEAARADVAQAFFSPHTDSLLFIAREGRVLRERVNRNVIVSVIRGKSDETTVQMNASADVAGRWTLLLQHERGSLEAAVAGVRRRNLAISFGILLLMGVSIGLLTVSSRRAQRLAQQQMEFVAGVSHELRTPVAVIRSAAENLSHGVVGDPARVRRYGEAIGVEARRLGEMVERVLQFAGIESGRPLPRTPVAVQPLVDDALAAIADETVRIERHIAPDLPPVAGDAAALRSAVQNLVANAVKYGGADRWIGVRAEAAQAGRAREVRITVEDHGAGIKAADLAHIFDPFYRGSDAVARQIQGSGLGLALVRRIVEAHGGRVTVVSHEGAGSAFTLHLPVYRATLEAASEQVALGSSPIAE